MCGVSAHQSARTLADFLMYRSSAPISLAEDILASDWLASVLAAERERIAQAIEAELTDSQEAAETTLAGAWQY